MPGLPGLLGLRGLPNKYITQQYSIACPNLSHSSPSASNPRLSPRLNSSNPVVTASADLTITCR